MKIRDGVLLKDFMTFKIGGPAKYFVMVKNTDELKDSLKFASDNNLSFFIIGGGSNILASDKGYDGLVIKIDFQNLTVAENLEVMEAGAGALLSKIVDESLKYELSGLEWAAGIPGTLGGAIRGNAGAYGSNIGQIIKQVEYYNTKNKASKVLDKKDCQFTYRSSIFKKNSNLIITSAVLQLRKDLKQTIQSKINDILDTRAQKQPKGMPSAGSFFVNPIVKNSKLIDEFEREKSLKCQNNQLPAAWLIEKVGLKGKKIGGAMISDIHPNYFLNTGKAKAEEIEILVSLVKQQVRDKLGVQLEEEVQYLGN
jgi:UDP-N-acetylmuramate dehydrogenase